MSIPVYRLVRTAAVALLLFSLPGFLPAAAHAQHLRSRSTSPAEDGPPGKAEEVSTDAYHATLSKRLRSSRHRLRSRHVLLPATIVSSATQLQLRLLCSPAPRFREPLPEQVIPLRC